MGEINYREIKNFFAKLREIEEKNDKTADLIEDITLVSVLGTIGDQMLKDKEIRSWWIKKLNEVSDLIRKKYFPEIESEKRK